MTTEGVFDHRNARKRRFTKSGDKRQAVEEVLKPTNDTLKVDIYQEEDTMNSCDRESYKNKLEVSRCDSAYRKIATVWSSTLNDGFVLKTILVWYIPWMLAHRITPYIYVLHGRTRGARLGPPESPHLRRHRILLAD